MKSKTATTVKIDKDLYGEFKILGIRKGLTLQDFVDKCVHLYVGENTFRTVVDTFVVPILTAATGSFSTVS